MLLKIMGASNIYCDNYVYKFTKYQVRDKIWIVKYWVVESHIPCSYLGFEFDRIPCRHAFAVMKHENMTTIPQSLILDR